MSEATHSGANAPEEREEREISFKIVFRILVITLVSAVIIHVGLAALLFLFARWESTSPTFWSQVREPTVRPRLETYTAEALDEVRSREKRILESYGWVSKENGVVRIPISKAMDLYLAEQGSKPGSKRGEQE